MKKNTIFDDSDVLILSLIRLKNKSFYPQICALPHAFIVLYGVISLF